MIHACCCESGVIFQFDINSSVSLSLSIFTLWLLLHYCVALSWPLPNDTQQSQMTAGLRDNPSRLIITLSPQWRKPDPKHGTARHGQPMAPLINERQPPWLLSFVCFERRVGNIPSKWSCFCTIVGVQRPWEWVGLKWRHVGKEFKDNFTDLQHYIAAISVPKTLQIWHIVLIITTDECGLKKGDFSKDWPRQWLKFPLVVCVNFSDFLLVACVFDRANTAWRWQSCMEVKYDGEKRESPAERKWRSDAEAARQRPWLFSEMNINNMTSHNRSTEIRGITSIVPPSPTDTDRSGEGGIRRIEEHNLAAHHAPLFKIHNGLWSSAMPFKCVLC